MKEITKDHQVKINDQWYDIMPHYQVGEWVLYVDKKPKPVNLELIKDLIVEVRYKHGIKLPTGCCPHEYLPFEYQLLGEIDLQSDLTIEERKIYDFWGNYFFDRDMKRMTIEKVAWQAFNLGRKLNEIKETKVDIELR